MLRTRPFFVAFVMIIQFSLAIYLLSTALAQDWLMHRPRGTLIVVDLHDSSISIAQNYAEALVTLDRDNRYVPCLAEDLRWIGDRTIEFRLRRGVRFHSGERFDADSVRVNWEEYKKLETPRLWRFAELSDETTFEILDKYTIRFTFPTAEGLVFPSDRA